MSRMRISIPDELIDRTVVAVESLFGPGRTVGEALHLGLGAGMVALESLVENAAAAAPTPGESMKWSTESDPVADIDAAIKKIQQATGVTPNKLMISAPVADMPTRIPLQNGAVLSGSLEKVAGCMGLSVEVDREEE